jgi:hypothetical protein
MVNIKINFRKKLLILYGIGLFLIPLILFMLSSDFFDSGQSICLSLVLFNQKCYGCGMTRAIQHLIHFEINKALYYNKLSFTTLPILLFLWMKEIYKIAAILRNKE